MKFARLQPSRARLAASLEESTMARLRNVAIGVALSALPLVVLQAADVALNVKTGLWQTTVAMQLSGQLPMSDADLAKMPPEKRQQIEAAIKATMANASQPHVVKSCVTAEQLRKGLSFKTEDQPSCKRTIVTSSSTTWEMHEECTGDSPRTSTIRFHANSPEEIDGEMHMTMTKGERTMTSNGTVHGKWLSSDCGSVKPGTAATK
jgi:Protein of unknown function (DUF3617)